MKNQQTTAPVGKPTIRIGNSNRGGVSSTPSRPPAKPAK